MRDATRSLLIFGTASLAAVMAGCVAMHCSGIAPSSWVRSIVAWLLGAVLALLLARYGTSRRVAIAAVVLAAAALIASLFAADIEGVRRWLDLGPLHINVAALVLPALIVGLAAMRMTTLSAIVVTLITAIVLLAQPDASQLTAVAVAASMLLMRSSVAPRWKLCALLAAIAFVIAGWMRPDPLQPVPEVEQIFKMCLAVSPFLALFAGLALAATTLTPLAFRVPRKHPARDAAIALCAYFVAVSIAPFLRWFPVPLVGLGMSFPAGWWLGTGLLVALNRRE